jgi:hypothetical protein
VKAAELFTTTVDAFDRLEGTTVYILTQDLHLDEVWEEPSLLILAELSLEARSRN